jgi:hypothetical protein
MSHLSWKGHHLETLHEKEHFLLGIGLDYNIDKDAAFLFLSDSLCKPHNLQFSFAKGPASVFGTTAYLVSSISDWKFVKMNQCGTARDEERCRI